MRLTHYTDYSLRTLIYLGLSESRKATIAEISHAYGISENHLVKVVHHLGRLGLVKTSRGRGGGLRLAQSVDKIIVGHVVRQTEEDLSLVECFANGACIITSTCRLRGVLGEALAAFLGVLDRYTLGDLINHDEGLEMAKLLGLFPLSKSAVEASRA
jgi:Rrf2 family nitric oxide-sensitive transcriptional repressor